MLTLFRKSTDIHKIRPVFNEETGTDGRTDMKILIAYFCTCFAKQPKEIALGSGRQNPQLKDIGCSNVLPGLRFVYNRRAPNNGGMTNCRVKPKHRQEKTPASLAFHRPRISSGHRGANQRLKSKSPVLQQSHVTIKYDVSLLRLSLSSLHPK